LKREGSLDGVGDRDFFDFLMMRRIIIDGNTIYLETDNKQIDEILKTTLHSTNASQIRQAGNDIHIIVDDFLPPLRSSVIYKTAEEKKIIGFALKSLIALFLMDKNIITMHSSSFFIHKHGAYVFTGASGVGKSTIVQNVSNANVLSDDVSILSFESGKWYVHPSMLDKGVSNRNKKGKYILRGIFTPIKSNEFTIKTMPLERQLKYLTENNLIYINAYFLARTDFVDEKCKQLNSMLINLLSQHPVREVYLQKNENLFQKFSD